MSLDSYLDGLTKEAEQKRVEQVYLKTATVDELKTLLGMEKKAACKKHNAPMKAKDKKKSAALQIGDKAGRTLAKMAQTPPEPWTPPAGAKPTPEELREAAQAAMAREDIPGRSRRWGRVGGAFGAGVGAGAGGTLGHFVSKALGAKSGLPGMIAGGLGLGAAGGLLGARIGKAEGAEEAWADRRLSQMRAQRNLLRGAQLGANFTRMQMAGGPPFQGGR